MTHSIYELENFRGVQIYSKCPVCDKEKTYQRYVFRNSGEQISSEIGKCNPNTGCSYHKGPAIPKFIPFYVDDKTLLESLDYTPGNNLFTYLKNKYGSIKTPEVMKKYLIGTSKVFPGATVLWQIDREGKARTGKISVFNIQTGEEIIKDWVHLRLKADDWSVQKCMFGEHLISDEPGKMHVIVENELSAIEGSCKIPGHIWLSNRGFGLGPNERERLKGKRVFYDTNTWKR